MGLDQAAHSLLALFGASGKKARAGALLLGSVLLAHRPKLPNVILVEKPDG
jgi:hypothetical protein